MESFRCVDWGVIPYEEAYEQQKTLFDEAVRNKLRHQPTVDTLIFCEHPPVITIGKSGKDSNLLFPEELLAENGVSLFHTDRGGDITFHGPGQLVGYPIIDLERSGIGLKDYIFRLEETIIRLLAMYDIEAGRLEGATGVWLDIRYLSAVRKICAIGVRASRYVTMHGFALNVHTDLNYFNLINPCGFTDKGVTSLEKELGTSIPMEEVKGRLLQLFSEIFCR